MKRVASYFAFRSASGPRLFAFQFVKGIMKRRIILSLIIPAFIVGVVGISFYVKKYSAVASIPTPTVDISNETEHFQVASAIINANVLTLTLKNTSNDPIIAYRIDFNPDDPKSDGIESDLSFSESLFPPQREMTLFVTLNKLKPKNGTRNYHLNIAMAYFANGWAEGSWEKAKVQQEKFEGIDKALRDFRENMPQQYTKDSFRKFAENTYKKGAPASLSKAQQLGYHNALNHIWVTSFQIAQRDNNEKDAALHLTALRSKLERMSERNNAFIKERIK